MKQNEKKDTKRQTFQKTLKATRYAFKCVWNESKGKIYVFLKFIMAIVNAFIPLVAIIMPGLVINDLTENQNIELLAVHVGLLLIIPVIGSLLNLIVNNALHKISLELNLSFIEKFYDRLLSMDYETLENPDIQIKKERAQDALSGAISVIDMLSNLVMAVISLFAISSVIITLNVFVIFLVIIIIVFNSVITKRVNSEKHSINQKLSIFDLYQGAYIYMLQHPSYAKEIRMFNIKSLLINLFSKSKKESNLLEVKYKKSGNKLSLFSTFANLIQQLILYSYLIYKVLFENLAIGTMTIYLSSVAQFSGALSSVFNSYLNIADRGQKTQELMEFFAIPLRQQVVGNRKVEFTSNSVFQFRNVSFKYPGSDRYVINNMCISIHANERLCIVGANGSGKSTFVKLLLRLYFPTEGEILLDGININEFDYKEYRKIFAPVFQDFASYTMTFGENIALSEEYDEIKLDNICKENGLSSLVSELPNGYHTQIGKWLDPEGINPSGGEEQRIAIARACYHGGKIFVLDEPTAAIDPMTEYDIYSQFNKMIRDNCAILITHRLSAVQLADKVAVFDNGKIIEYGTHDELYSDKGIYTEMFDKQAKFYRETSQETENKTSE